MTTGTLGKTSAGSSFSGSSQLKQAVSKVTATANGFIHVGHAHLWLSAAGSYDAMFVVYSDNAGAPDRFIGASDVRSGLTNTTDTVIDFPFSVGSAVPIVNGTSYWIGVQWSDPGTPNVNLGRDATAAQRLEVATPAGIGFGPDPFGTGTSLSGPIAAWVDWENAPADKKLYATHPDPAYGLTAMPTNGTDGTGQLLVMLDFADTYWGAGSTIVVDGTSGQSVKWDSDVANTSANVDILAQF